MRFFWWRSENNQNNHVKGQKVYVMRCHYDVLGVAREATAEEITRAFRKAALRLHPDKNPDRADEAAEEFKELRKAYEVLSDPHERKWYDDHREDILRGRDPLEAAEDSAAATGSASRSEWMCSRATELNLYAYFQPSAYAGYEADERGFCQVYGSVFDQLAQEEVDAGGARPPSFGSMATAWKEVRRFYNIWENFVSAKSFSFADKWNPNEAPNRETRRAMERENRRERERARREFQTLVRELVTFVKKRDRRVLKHKEEEARREAEKIERQAQEREQREHLRALHAARLAAQLEEDLPNLDELLEHLEYAATERDEQEAEDVGVSDDGHAPSIDGVHCLACKKQFKTFAQWSNHEKSKKHRDSVRQFRRQLCLAKDEQVQVCRILGQQDMTADRNAETNDSDRSSGGASSTGDTEHFQPHADAVSDGESLDEHDKSEDDTQSMFRARDSAQAHPSIMDDMYLSTDRNEPAIAIEISHGHPRTSSRAQIDASAASTGEKEGHTRLAVPPMEADGAFGTHSETNRAPRGKPITSGEQQRVKSRRRRAQTLKDRRRAAATSAAPDQTMNMVHACQTCQSTFSSRNALFRHLRETGHAQAL
jgi:DnaJ family protein A protein 5